MATTKGGNGKVATDDLLADLEDATPLPRKSGPRDTVAFVPNEALVALFTASFGRTGAAKLNRAYPTVKDARAATNIHFRHAEEAASIAYPTKSVARRFVPNEDGTFYVAFELTHKRKVLTAEEKAAKEAAKAAAATTPTAETPAAETPATK